MSENDNSTQEAANETARKYQEMWKAAGGDKLGYRQLPAYQQPVTLRDRYALAVIQSGTLVRRPLPFNEADRVDFAAEVFMLADALLARREVKA